MARGNKSTGNGRYANRRKPQRRGPTRIALDGLFKRVARMLHVRAASIFRLVASSDKETQGKLIRSWRRDVKAAS